MTTYHIIWAAAACKNCQMALMNLVITIMVVIPCHSNWHYIQGDNSCKPTKYLKIPMYQVVLILLLQPKPKFEQFQPIKSYQWNIDTLYFKTGDTHSVRCWGVSFLSNIQVTIAHDHWNCHSNLLPSSLGKLTVGIFLYWNEQLCKCIFSYRVLSNLSKYWY